MGQLKSLKVAWANEFTKTIEFFDEVERWLVWYTNKNDEVDNTLHQSELYLREFKIHLIEIKTKHEITVAPLREYIEEWLNKELIEIMPSQSQHVPISEPTASK
jgi:hypothetical protein